MLIKLDGGAYGTRAAYGRADLERPADLRHKWDPDNFCRHIKLSGP